ncbi:MAG: sulfotransferase [Acidocella sp.]|nr:sulfotransferase [Acidocella sp.]
MTIPDQTPCPCGSQLRRIRCCQVDARSLPGEAALALLETPAQEAVNLFNAKDTDEAETLALNLLDLAPNLRPALRVLFEIRKSQGLNDTAAILATRLAALPGPAALRAAANTLCAQFLVTQGRHQAARAAAAAALIAAPNDASIQHLMGVVLTESGQFAAGEQHYRRAQILAGASDGLVLANTAWNLKRQGRLNEAATLYETALALRPDNSRAAGGQAQVVFAQGDHQRAISLLDAAITRWPDDRTLIVLRAMADLATNPRAVLDRLGDPNQPRSSIELCLRGQALDRLDDPAAAYACFAQAKTQQQARTGAYVPVEIQEKSVIYRRFFISDRILPLRPLAPPSGPMPVFLLGFPRSGTSLLAQLLAHIPGIVEGNDQPAIANLAAGLAGYPECLNEILLADSAIRPAAMAAQYLAGRCATALAQPGFIIDRAVGNAWHLGLIKLLFPEAPIIHVLRHPLDIVLANFAQDHPLEANCGVSLAAIARHYALTMDMIRHYRGQLALRYLPVRYEDLIATPNAVLGRVLGFIGADTAACPPDAVLRANAHPLPDPVPAHMAVRAPIHAHAAGRHRRYAEAIPGLFADIEDIVGPWIESQSYQAAA